MALLLAHGIERTPSLLGCFFGLTLNFVIFLLGLRRDDANDVASCRVSDKEAAIDQTKWSMALNAIQIAARSGALLREGVIPATGKTKADIARLLGISRQHLYDVLHEHKPVSPVVAVRLGKFCLATAPRSGYACRRLARGDAKMI